MPNLDFIGSIHKITQVHYGMLKYVILMIIMIFFGSLKTKLT